ncbi:MAG: hypothetical protein ACFE8A_10220 [Candidatus Hodarchaeota archaeon]
MKGISLTRAYIQSIDDPTNINLNISISDKRYLKDNPYLLVIQTNQENRARLAIYPVKVKNLIKVSLFGLKTSDKTTSYLSLSKIFQEFDIIHTSGLIIKGNELHYECYLNLSLSDVKTEVLKVALNKIKNIFRDISIKEICLK